MMHSYISMNVKGIVRLTFFPFIFGWGKKSLVQLPIALFVLPDPQILEMLIGMDRVERLANEARVTLNHR